MNLARYSLCCMLVLSAATTLLAQEYASPPVARPVKLAGATDVAPKQVSAFPFDTVKDWGKSNLPEDKPIRFEAVTDKAQVHEGAGAVRFVFQADIGPQGMQYFQLPSGATAGSDGYAFWVLGDGSGAVLQIRLSQGDWSAWDSRQVRLDFVGWRQVVVLKSECDFANWGHNGPKWEDIRVVALRLSGKSAKAVLDDLRFYVGTAGLKVQRVPDAPPITLQIDAAKELPAIPDMLKGNDFALVNWSAGSPGMGYSPETEKLFRASGTKLVRFWTYCPPLDLSKAAGEYDWKLFDFQMGKITEAGAATIMTCCFTPLWLSADGTKEGMPKDWPAYEKLISDTVAHCKEKGFRVAYWEVWNEPNLNGGFLKGGKLADLCEIYTHFVKAVRSADPKAKVGGPAPAGPDMVWIRGFSEFVQKNDLPVDFISWHVYDLMPDGLGASIETARKITSQFPRVKDAELIIDEWNSQGGPSNRYDTEVTAAFQVAALDQMLAKGLAAQTFFAFKETCPEFTGQGDNNWGMITLKDLPKASYQSFRAFAELAGPRVAVTGSDGEVGAIAARNGQGVDVLLYRFQPDENAIDRDVHLDLSGLAAPAVKVTLELIDNVHSNTFYDRGRRDLELVAVWSPVKTSTLKGLTFTLRPCAVARVRIAPDSGAGVDAATMNRPLPAPAYAGQVVPLPLGPGSGQVSFLPSRDWKPSADGRSAVISAGARTRQKLYLGVQTGTGVATTTGDIVPPGIVARTRLVGPGAWAPGAERKLAVELFNAGPLDVKGTVSLAGAGVKLAQPSAPFVLPSGAGTAVIFTGTLEAGYTGEAVLLGPRVTVDSVSLAGKSLAVAYADPLAAPVADEYTTLLCGLSSAGDIAKPAKGPGGTVEKAAAFQPGKFGPALLGGKDVSVTFPAPPEAFPAQVGSLELWVTPQWEDPDAPGWGTLFLRCGSTGWNQSMWDLRFGGEKGKSTLIWALSEERGGHELSAPVSDWKAGQPHHVMITWNALAGHLALYVDGKLAQERTAPTGLELNSQAKDMSINRVGGRAACNALLGPVRISSVERVPGAKVPPPAIAIDALGLEVRTGK